MDTIFRFGYSASLAALLCLVISIAMSGPAVARSRHEVPPANAEEPAPAEAPPFFVISRG